MPAAASTAHHHNETSSMKGERWEILQAGAWCVESHAPTAQNPPCFFEAVRSCASWNLHPPSIPLSHVTCLVWSPGSGVPHVLYAMLAKWRVPSPLLRAQRLMIGDRR